jgi:hypothetical protein
MSSQSSIFSLNGLEHWYEECVAPRDSIGIEFDESTIEDVDTTPGNGITVWIKADSQLGKLLSNPEVKAVLERVAAAQNASEAVRWQELLEKKP